MVILFWKKGILLLSIKKNRKFYKEYFKRFLISKKINNIHSIFEYNQSTLTFIVKDLTSEKLLKLNYTNFNDQLFWGSRIF